MSSSMNFVMTGLYPKLGEVVQICNLSILEVGGVVEITANSRPTWAAQRDLVSNIEHTKEPCEVWFENSEGLLQRGTLGKQQNKQTTKKNPQQQQQRKILTTCSCQCETFAEREGVPADLFWSPSDPFLSLCRSPSSAITFHRRTGCAFKQAGLKYTTQAHGSVEGTLGRKNMSDA